MSVAKGLAVLTGGALGLAGIVALGIVGSQKIESDETVALDRHETIRDENAAKVRIRELDYEIAKLGLRP